MKRLVISICLVLLLATNAYSWSLFGPKNYEDCVIEAMKGVTSDVAAREIKKACRKKFPIKTRKLSRKERDKISITPVRQKCAVWDQEEDPIRHKCDGLINFTNYNSSVTIRSLTVELRYRGEKLSFVCNKYFLIVDSLTGLPLRIDPVTGPSSNSTELRWYPFNIGPGRTEATNLWTKSCTGITSFKGHVDWPETVYADVVITEAMGY